MANPDLAQVAAAARVFDQIHQLTDSAYVNFQGGELASKRRIWGGEAEGLERYRQDLREDAERGLLGGRSWTAARLMVAELPAAESASIMQQSLQRDEQSTDAILARHPQSADLFRPETRRNRRAQLRIGSAQAVLNGYVR